MTSDLLLLQLSLLVILMLLSINSTPQVYALLTLLYIVHLGLMLTCHNLGTFGLILLAGEIHVVYITMCLLLSWVGPDHAAVDALRSSARLNHVRVVVLLAVVLLGTLILMGIGRQYLFGLDNYYTVLLVSQVSVGLTSVQGVTSSTLGSLALGLLTINSIEFLLLNIYMLLALFAFYMVARAQTSNRFMTRTRGVAVLLRSTNLNSEFTRSARHSRVCTRCVAVNSGTAVNSRV